MSLSSIKEEGKWAIVVGIEKDIEEHLIGSWTDFNGQVTEQTNVRKCFLQYLPTIPRPLYQQYFYSIYQSSLSKNVLDELLKVMRDLDSIDHIFAHVSFS